MANAINPGSPLNATSATPPGGEASAQSVARGVADKSVGKMTTGDWVNQSRKAMGGDQSDQAAFTRVDGEAKRLLEGNLPPGEQASIHLVDASALIKRANARGGALSDEADADGSFAELQKAQQLAPHQHDVVQQHSRFSLSMADKGGLKRAVIGHHLGVNIKDMAANDTKELLAASTSGGKVDALDPLMAQRLAKFTGDKQALDTATNILAGLPQDQVEQARHRLDNDAKAANVGDNK
jgi:hypothetical protein